MPTVSDILYDMNLRFYVLRSASSKKLLLLALPLIMANLSQPLLGLVDTAVLGHLGDAQLLAGAAVGTFLLSQIIWLLGFLRMSISGLAAQQFGALSLFSSSTTTPTPKARAWFDELARGLTCALLLGAGLYLLSGPLLTWIKAFTELPALAQSSLHTYFSIRVANAPIILFNLVLIGWMVGHQRTKHVMWIQILGNLTNIALNLILVFGFDLSVAGLAYATVTTEWLMCIASIAMIFRYVQSREQAVSAKLSESVPAAPLSQQINASQITLLSPNWFRLSRFYRLLSLNRDLFIRSVFLQLCLAFVTYQGARYGVEAAAINALLMQFFVIIALGLDGIANAIEALIGEAQGQADERQKWQNIGVSFMWSSLFALSFAIIFALGFSDILGVLTNQIQIIAAAQPYYGLIVALPLLAHWCYCLDGIYIGLTRADIMRNSMFVSALFGFFFVYWLTLDLQNVGLWYALLALQTMRGLTLGGHLLWLYNKRLNRLAKIPR